MRPTSVRPLRPWLTTALAVLVVAAPGLAPVGAATSAPASRPAVTVAAPAVTSVGSPVPREWRSPSPRRQPGAIRTKVAASTVPISTVPISTVPTSTVPISTVPISTVPISTVPTSTVTTGTGIGYGFDTGTDGWAGENVVVAHDTSRAAAGAGSVRLSRAVDPGYGVLRANDSRAAVRDLQAGGTVLTARVLVPAGAAGTWTARLEVQDVGWSYRAGNALPLTPGTWAEVRYDVPLVVAQQARAVGVQVEVRGATGTVAVNLDEVRQRSATPTPTPTTAPSTSAPRDLHVVGTRVVDGAGRTVRLLGVNHSGTEYACSQGWGFFDAPSTETPSPTVLAGIRSWGATAVRVPLNEHCWLDVDSGIPASRRGAAYRRAITDHVAAINAQGMVAILDLHWSAPGTRRTDNNPMPNRDNSPRFWRSVATHFRANPSVVFELANEPHPDGGADSTEAWRCWRDGGTCRGTVDTATRQPYVAAGMQELMDAVRGTGARQLVLVGGVQWTNRLTGWNAHRPYDPLGNTAAAWHVYNFNGCTTPACWSGQVAPVADRVPLVATEIGPDQACLTCPPSPTGFSESLLDWLDARGAGYTAWTWNRWDGDAHVLVRDWAGTQPTPWGAQVRARLLLARK